MFLWHFQLYLLFITPKNIDLREATDKLDNPDGLEKSIQT